METIYYSSIDTSFSDNLLQKTYLKMDDDDDEF